MAPLTGRLVLAPIPKVPGRLVGAPMQRRLSVTRVGDVQHACQARRVNRAPIRPRTTPRRAFGGGNAAWGSGELAMRLRGDWRFAVDFKLNYRPWQLC